MIDALRKLGFEPVYGPGAFKRGDTAIVDGKIWLVARDPERDESGNLFVNLQLLSRDTKTLGTERDLCVKRDAHLFRTNNVLRKPADGPAFTGKQVRELVIAADSGALAVSAAANAHSARLTGASKLTHRLGAALGRLLRRKKDKND